MENKNRILAIKKHFKNKWNEKLLFIDDDLRINYIWLQAMLAKTQTDIICENYNSQTNNVCLENNNFDNELIGYNMPMMNDYETTLKIKSVRNYMPIIFHSSYLKETPEFINISTTCDNYILTSIDRDSLLTKIENYLNTSRIHT